MAADLRALVRVRQLRAELAERESSRLRKVTAGAEAAVDEARSRRELHLQQAAQASVLASNGARASDGGGFLAAEAQGLMDFAASARFKAREDVARIRRAELVRDRAKETSDAAREEYRRLTMRRDAVSAHADRQRRTGLKRKLDREDEAIIEEQTTRSAVAANEAQDRTDDMRADQ